MKKNIRQTPDCLQTVIDLYNSKEISPAQKLVIDCYLDMNPQNAAIFSTSRNKNTNTGFPSHLRDYVSSRYSIPWKAAIPGISLHEIAVDKPANAFVKIVKAEKGVKLPEHDHDDLELSLVLDGAFYDKSGRYEKGDIAIAPKNTRHRPRACKENGCICLIVSEQPIRLTGIMGALTGLIQRLKS